MTICPVGWHRGAEGGDELEREFRDRMAGTWGGKRENVQNDFQISTGPWVGGEAFSGRQAGLRRDDTKSGLRWVG